MLVGNTREGEVRMGRRNDWLKAAMRMVPLFDVDRCIDELFDGGLITFGLPERL
jgi:hypothetical protein